MSPLKGPDSLGTRSSSFTHSQLQLNQCLYVCIFFSFMMETVKGHFSSKVALMFTLILVPYRCPKKSTANVHLKRPNGFLFFPQKKNPKTNQGWARMWV